MSDDFDFREIARYLIKPMNVVKAVGTICFAIVAIAVTIFIVVQLWNAS